MSSISLQLDVMRENKKQGDEDLVVGVFCPKCIKKHPLRECLLEKVEVCGMCDLEHETKYFPLLSKYKSFFQSSIVDTEKNSFIS